MGSGPNACPSEIGPRSPVPSDRCRSSPGSERFTSTVRVALATGLPAASADASWNVQ